MQKLQIRNSIVEFLIFTKQSKEKTIEVIVDNNSVWLSLKLIAELFGTTRNNVTMHLKNIFANELDKDVIIAVGFKINSQRTIEFRLWAIDVLKSFSIKGYVLDKERLKNGSFIDNNYFEELLQEIREIRISERNFYQKITDIYATSLDYNVNSPLTKLFFKTLQNKMHYAFMVILHQN